MSWSLGTPEVSKDEIGSALDARFAELYFEPSDELKAQFETVRDAAVKLAESLPDGYGCVAYTNGHVRNEENDDWGTAMGLSVSTRQIEVEPVAGDDPPTGHLLRTASGHPEEPPADDK